MTKKSESTPMFYFDGATITSCDRAIADQMRRCLVDMSFGSRQIRLAGKGPVATCAQRIVDRPTTFSNLPSTRELTRKALYPEHITFLLQGVHQSLYLKWLAQYMEAYAQLSRQVVFVDADTDYHNLINVMATTIMRILSEPILPNLHQSFLTPDGTSVLLIKPEFWGLDLIDQYKIFRLMEDLWEKTFIGKVKLRLSLDLANALWLNDLLSKGYTWASAYCKFMTAGDVMAVVLRGQNTADTIKKTVRQQNKPLIESLSADTPFQQDLIHGSDPGAGPREMDIMSISVKSRLNG